jgi:hypothetical protein
MFNKIETFVKDHKDEIAIFAVEAACLITIAVACYSAGVMDGVRTARPTIVS